MGGSRAVLIRTEKTMANKLTVQPLTGALGAEISGIDLSTPLNEGAYLELRNAWLEHKVLFFRDQQMSPEEHIAFAKAVH